MKTIRLLLIIMLSYHSTGYGQITNTQNEFQDFFTTAGYGTAFGAALGAATLPFKSNPEKHLRSVAIGASLGFISGSLLGSYIIFSPSMASQEKATQPPVTLMPITNDSLAITGIAGTWTVKKF